MNDSQENKLGMYRATGQVLTDNAAIFAAVPAMVTQHQNLLDSIALIDSLAQAQIAVKKGITVDKKVFQLQMVDYTMRVAGGLMAYASAEGNNTLLAKAKSINDTKFVRARDDVRDDIAQDIHDEANAIIAQLAGYNVTAATLSALQTRIDAYRLYIVKPKLAIGDGSKDTALLKQEFARADVIVKERLDGLIRTFKETNPNFVMVYTNARKITNTGSKPQPPPPTP